MASVKILVRHIESNELVLMDVNDDEPVQISRAALREYGYDVVDDHASALRRLYAEPRRARPYQAVAAYLRIR